MDDTSDKEADRTDLVLYVHRNECTGSSTEVWTVFSGFFFAFVRSLLRLQWSSRNSLVPSAHKVLIFDILLPARAVFTTH